MTMAIPAGGGRVAFGPFELDVAAGDLYRDGHRVRLQEQPRQVLAALLGRPGEVVTREELRERLWKTDTFVDFEHGLNTAIKKVRQALGDSAENPQYVETLARRGYRFVAPVTPVAPVAPVASVASEPAVIPGPSYAGRTILVLLLAGVIGAAMWLAGITWKPAPGPSSRVQAQLAVLPLRVLASPGAGDSAYLGVGIADAITTRLANVRQIALRPTSAVLPYQNREADPAVVAASLGVQHLLSGTIQQAEDS